jgi:hypothetical protein
VEVGRRWEIIQVLMADLTNETAESQPCGADFG